MFTIFSYLACAAFIMLIIGLIKPNGVASGAIRILIVGNLRYSGLL